MSGQRENRSDIPKELRQLTTSDPSRFGYIDYLWNVCKFEGLVAELAFDLAEIRREEHAVEHSANSSESAQTSSPASNASPESQQGQTSTAESDPKVMLCIELARQILKGFQQS
jgi:hypothetical protein